MRACWKLPSSCEAPASGTCPLWTANAWWGSSPTATSTDAPSLLGNITPEEYNAIFENTPLERVMTRNPLTVTPATPLREAAGLLHQRKLGWPVVEDGRLVGILTVTDMLAVLLGFLNDATPQASSAEDR